MKLTKEYIVTWFDPYLVKRPVSSKFDDFNKALAYFEEVCKNDIDTADLFVIFYDEDGSPFNSQELLTYRREYYPQIEEDYIDFDNHPDGD